MLHRQDPDLKPRNGHTLMAATSCRISGCPNQKELSLEDQEDNARDSVRERYDGAFELDVIASTIAKGERLDRPELEKIENAYRSGKYL
jgi:site-specific DNA recombinase